MELSCCSLMYCMVKMALRFAGQFKFVWNQLKKNDGNLLWQWVQESGWQFWENIKKLVIQQFSLGVLQKIHYIHNNGKSGHVESFFSHSITKNPTNLRQLIFSPEVSSHSCSLCILLSVHCFPQLSVNTADKTEIHLIYCRQNLIKATSQPQHRWINLIHFRCLL